MTTDPHDLQPAHLFSRLGPDCVLDALDSIGLRGDGRLLALNSYENRVYQLGTDAGNRVLKFYRAGRWSDALSGHSRRRTGRLNHAATYDHDERGIA